MSKPETNDFISELGSQVIKGMVRATARAISVVENNDPGKQDLLASLGTNNIGRALTIGITGPPGAGKSTLLNGILTDKHSQGKKAAVIAVDPSSPFSGGALLGDRLRMQSHATDAGIFIRSMASRGSLGGLSEAVPDAIRVLEAAGFDTIFVETLGVGQSEIEVMYTVDAVILALAPGLGDEIQAMKAGVMEIGDLFVINKKDRPGSDKLKAEIEYLLSLKVMDEDKKETDFIPEVVMTNAKAGEGIDGLVSAMERLTTNLRKSGLHDKRREQRVRERLHSMLRNCMVEKLEKELDIDVRLAPWAVQVLNGRMTPYSIIDKVMEELA